MCCPFFFCGFGFLTLLSDSKAFVFDSSQEKDLRAIPFLILLLILVNVHCGSQPERTVEQPSELQTLLKSKTQKPQDIILITIDTWRHDATSFSGSSRVKTPTIDSLANTGVVFDNAYAHATITLPSHASLLTGLLPFNHGLRDNAGYRLSPEHTTIAGYLKTQGYRTGAFISAFPLDSRYGLGHDFDHYDDQIDRYAKPLAKVTERPASDTLKQAKAWLDQQTTQPTFTWVHVYEPHYPYEPPEPFKSQYSENPYFGEVAYVDALLGDFLKPYLSGNRKATIVVTSDHGEGLGEHGEATHGLFAYEATIKVPMIIWSPELLRAGQLTTPTGQIDLLPTLLELYQFPLAKGLDGRSLLSKSSTPDIYFESLSTYFNRGWAPLRGCIQSPHKAIQLPIPELYNLEEDPSESKNLASGNRKRLDTCLTCIPTQPLAAAGRENLSAEEREKLASLGYASSSGSRKLEGVASDPKNLVAVDNEIYAAFGMATKGQFIEASQRLQTLIKQHPQVELAYQYASDYAYQAGQLERAIQILDLAFQRGIAGEMSCRKLALYLIQARRFEPAQNILTIFKDSDDPETHSAWGKLFTNLGQFDQALAAFQKALSLDASNPSVWSEIGTMHLYAKQLPKAKQAFEKAIQQNDRLADAFNGLGVVYAQTGDLNAAAQSWKQALSINPNLAFCHKNLANIYLRKGDVNAAKTHLEAYAELVTGQERAATLERLRNLR